MYVPGLMYVPKGTYVGTHGPCKWGHTHSDWSMKYTLRQQTHTLRGTHVHTYIHSHTTSDMFQVITRITSHVAYEASMEKRNVSNIRHFKDGGGLEFT